MVGGDQVYVRSVRGDRGYWYQSARERPDDVALRVDSKTISVKAEPAFDEASITAASVGFEAKYRRSGASLASMLQPKTLATTLRLEPR